MKRAAALAWCPHDTPLDVFLEIAPIVDMGAGDRATEVSANGGIGLRFYFQ